MKPLPAWRVWLYKWVERQRWLCRIGSHSWTTPLLADGTIGAEWTCQRCGRKEDHS